MKQCFKCKESKEETEFGKLQKSKDGLNPNCLDCMRSYHRNLYLNSDKRKKDIRKNDLANRKRLQEFRLNYFKNRSCVDCGNEDYRVFEFDHTSDDKEFNISEAIKKCYSLDRIKNEMSKCELVCANCHRIRTWDRRQGAVAKSG